MIPGWLRDWLKHWGTIIAVVFVAALIFGVPHLKVSWRSYVEGYPISCRYLGPFGVVDAKPGKDVMEGCPYVVLLPLWEWDTAKITAVAGIIIAAFVFVLLWIRSRVARTQQETRARDEELARKARQEQEWRKREEQARRKREQENARDHDRIRGPWDVKGNEAYEWALDMMGLQDGFTKAELKKRYRTLQQKLHPDKEGSAGLAKLINKAHDILTPYAKG